MRVLFAGQTYAPSTNGPAVFTTNLAETLTQRGHLAVAAVPSTDGRGRHEQRNGVAVHALPAIVARRLEVAVSPLPNRQLGRLLDDVRPDLVHIQDHYPTSRAVLAESRRRGVPVVGTNHFIPENIALQLALPAVGRRPAEALLWWTVAAVFRRLDAVTAPSATAAALLEQRLRGLHPRAISCGVDVARFRPRSQDERLAARRRLGLPSGASVALYVGRVDDDKNLGLLLRALRLTPEPAMLVVAGKGLRLTALERRAQRWALGERVRFTGYVPDEELPRLYAACDLFVMPSRVELLSIATLEAMASGLPVAAARAGALPELVEEGVNGVLFDGNDAADAAAALRRLAANPASWRGWGEEARRRAEGHRLELVAERFEELYREVLGAHQASS